MIIVICNLNLGSSSHQIQAGWLDNSQIVMNAPQECGGTRNILLGSEMMEAPIKTVPGCVTALVKIKKLKVILGHKS